MFINTLSDYLLKNYGKKMYKISLDGGMTCPNRDGAIGKRGCIFCSNKGSGEFAQRITKDIDEQFDKGKKLLSKKNTSTSYIAYFQSYTNTYAPLCYLKELFLKVINREDVAILSIATRPDCINKEICSLLKTLSKIKPVWVELGLQTTNENSIKYIRRGYNNEVYERAVSLLRETDCHIITHLILGLPNETKSDMITSAKYAGEYSDGIKFHTLYITNDADISKDYLKNKFKLLTRDEYIDTLCECIRFIPKNVVIHRLTGDGDKKKLLGPLWSEDKKKVLQEIKYALIDRDINQGEKLKNAR